MTTIATQTNNDLTSLYRFRDVAEDTCSAEAVTDALMSQIEERDKRIQSLEGVVELYQQIEKDLLHDRRHHDLATIGQTADPGGQHHVLAEDVAFLGDDLAGIVVVELVEHHPVHAEDLPQDVAGARV